MQPVIEFQSVSRHFDQKVVLDGFDLQLNQGEVLALLGRNGTGKTTALSILMGFLDPIDGCCKVYGTDSRDLSPAERDRIGFVPEGHLIYGQRDLETTLDFEAGTRPRFDLAYAKQLVGHFELPRKGLISKYSRGQRAQLSLILAVAARPDLLIFDDPALGLDVAARRDVLDTMIDLLSDQGSSVLFSSHSMVDVERLANRINLLQDGGVILDADVLALKQNLRCRLVQPSESLRHSHSGSSREINKALEAQVGGWEGVWSSRCMGNGDSVDGARDAVELWTFAVDAQQWTDLEAAGWKLSEQRTPSLEELFIELTTKQMPSGNELHTFDPAFAQTA